MALPSLLDEALELWQFARQGVIDEVRNLPQSALDARPAAGARTITEIVHHIAESGLMMAGELTRKDGNFQRQSYGEFLQEYGEQMERPNGKKELIALLERTHGDGVRKIRSAGEQALLQPITQFNGKDARRLTWMHHGIGHEEYHRGQIAFAGRILGHVPALTKLIHGE